MQWTARRLQIFGIHYHVGVRSAEKSIVIANALQFYLAHLLALSASSPYWEGHDTGLASCRVKVFEGLPTAGLPPVIEDWADFEQFMHTLVSAEAIKTIREVWWDVRPHPVGLVGENGAGKSTLVKIIAGVHRRDAGRDAPRRRERRLHLHRRVEGGRRRGHLPGADALPRPVGHREHLHGPPAARRGRRLDRPRMYAEASSCSRGSVSGSIPADPLSASPSPTSRSSRSPRRSRSTPGSSSWTSPPRRSAASRSSGSSRSPAASATRAARSSSSPTASTRSSTSATPSR